MRTSRDKFWLTLTAAGVVLLAYVVDGVISADDPVVDPNSPSAGVSEDPNELRWDLAGAFEFDWESAEVSLSSKILHLSENTELDSGIPVSILTISVSLGWNPLTTDELIIIDFNSSDVYEVRDENGNIVEFQATRSNAMRSYEEWPWYWVQGVARLNTTMGPTFNATIRLSSGPGQSAPSSFSLVKGYIYAIYASDVVEVDIPFDPNGGWLETKAAPDLTIRFDPRTPPCPEPYRPGTPVALYKYKTWVKSKMGRPVLGVRDAWPYCPRDLCPFGDYAILRTELFNSKRGSSIHFPTQWIQSDLWASDGTCCWGQVEQGSSDAYDSVRHIIAVRPVEVKIPFVLRNIPVPNLQSADQWEQ